MQDNVMTQEMIQKLREGIVDAIQMAGDWELSADKQEYRIEFDGINLLVCHFNEHFEGGYEVIAKYRIDFTRVK